MAESVQYHLERMIPELEALEKKHIFSNIEIKSIIKKRTNLEYALQRRIKQKIDFLRAIEYEINLDELCKKRVNRLGLTSKLIGTELNYSGEKRIYQLFKRALIKFKADLSLWLQYIAYAKKNRANNILSGIFVQAIQFHPKNASLWIMAANWEHEHNQNMAAARVLFQRAIRLMPDNQRLWHEYSRLELIYIEKIKIRRRLLGIDEKSMQESNMDSKEKEDNMDVDADTIQLPAVTGEDVSQWEEDQDGAQKKKIKLDEEAMLKMEESNNPILQGLLATIVYDNAIKDIPDDIAFRQKFVDIYREFSDTEKHIQHVYETIESDMKHTPAARAFLAARHLYVVDQVSLEKNSTEEKTQYVSMSDPKFVPAMRKSVQEFETALAELSRQSEMWHHYVLFLTNWHQLVTEENLKLYLNKLIQKTFKNSQKEGVLNKELYEAWAAFLLNVGESEKADKIAMTGLKAYPDSAKLWLDRIGLAKENSEREDLYKKALDNNTESLSLWTSYKDWIESLEDETADALFYRACEKATLLLPAVTRGSSDRNEIKVMVQSSYVCWAAKTHGIDHARKVYKKIIHNFYPTYPFFSECVKVENEYGNAETGPEFVEYLYDRIVRLDNDKEGSYVSYLAYLYSLKKFQLANQVYNRAIKEVPNQESFDLKVQNLKTQSTL